MHPTNCANTLPAPDADNNLVPFPKSETSPEDQARRLTAEVDRLARLSTTEWLYYLDTGRAEKFGLTRVAMQTMIEKVIERNEKAKQEAKGEARREQTAKQKQDAEVKREQERELARLEKESARKGKAKAKAFKALVPLPSKDRRTRLAALAMQLGEDLDTLAAEFDVFIGADKREAGAIEPWADSVDAGELLAELTAQVRRFIVMHDDMAMAIALWVMFAWVHASAMHSPILVITSAEKDSGKSTLLGVLGYLAPRPYATVEVTGPGSIDFDSAKTRAHLFSDCPSFLCKIVLRRRIVWFDRTDGTKEAPKENHCWCIWSTPVLRIPHQPVVLYAPEVSS